MSTCALETLALSRAAHEQSLIAIRRSRHLLKQPIYPAERSPMIESKPDIPGLALAKESGIDVGSTEERHHRDRRLGG
jgi:hypothetical protein